MLRCTAVSTVKTLREHLSAMEAGDLEEQRLVRLASGRLELLGAGLRERYPLWIGTPSSDLPLTGRHFLSAMRAMNPLPVEMPLLSGPLMSAADPPDDAYSWRRGGVSDDIKSVFSLILTYNGGPLNIIGD
jgi:hypothetical protein